MAKLSINEAAKRFHVSRPTLLKHLKSGKLSGDKDDGNRWQIDAAELTRIYQPRSAPAPVAKESLPANLSTIATPLADDLKAENERLKADLAVAQALADERGKRLDQLVPLLAAPPKRRRWWPWG